MFGLLVDSVVEPSDMGSPPAPDFALSAGPEGKQTSLSSLRGSWVLVNFWASWCAPCKSETPLLERLQRQIAPRGGTVLGVNYRDTTGDANAFTRHYGLTYQSLRDVDGNMAQDYGTRALPETFVIDRQGKVTAVSRGEVNSTFLSRSVGPLLSS
jgi:cytochrome c biogenesis protein CcmG/thiol:disulfide interchange protein DsbE